MGVSQFTARTSGPDAAAAFMSACEEAKHLYGHGGYSGSIAEKSEFVEIPVPAGADPVDYANELMFDDDPRISDKSGPAGCVLLKSGTVKVTKRVEQPVSKTKIQQHIHKGARKWKTYYSLYQGGKWITRAEHKDEAEKLARSLAATNRAPVNIRLEKHLDGSNSLVAVVEPVIPKDDFVQESVPTNEYLFFGFASA